MLYIPALLLSLLATDSVPSRSSLMVSLCDSGEHRQFEEVECNIKLKNNGDRPIRVSGAVAQSDSDAIDGAVLVPAKGEAYLAAKVKVNDAIGYTHRFFSFDTDEPKPFARRKAEVQFFATTILDQSTPSIAFGPVRLDRPLESKSVTLSSREVSDLRIMEVLSAPDYVTAKIEGAGTTLRVSVNPNAPWGLVHEKIKLRLNATQQREAWVTLEANVEGDIVPDSNPVSLGMMRTDKKNEYLVRLSSRSGKAFKIGALTLEGIKGTAEPMPCADKSESCRLVRVKISKDQMLGRVGGVLYIELPDFKRRLPIRMGGGLLLNAETQVHDLNKEQEKARIESSPAQSAAEPSAASTKVDIAKAIGKKIQEQEMPPSGTGPLLRWSVAHETPVFGYIIYRADADTGPFLRVNKETIRAASDAESTGNYQWRDNSAQPGKTYWYQIGMIKSDGEKADLSGAQRVVAK